MNPTQLAAEAAAALCHADPIGNLPFNTAIIQAAIEKAYEQGRYDQYQNPNAFESRAAQATRVNPVSCNQDMNPAHASEAYEGEWPPSK